MCNGFLEFQVRVRKCFALKTLGLTKIKVLRNLGFIYHDSLVFLLISKFTNGLCLHQFLGTKATEANKSLKTDANGAH